MANEYGVRVIPSVGVNLMPPEAEQRRQAARIQVVAMAVVAGAVVVVGLLYLLASQQLSTAKDDLAEAREQNVELAARKAQLNSVDQLIAQKDARERQLTGAMGEEVLWSTYLNTIQRTLPDRVWVVSMTAILRAGATPTAPDAIGNIVVIGKANSTNVDDIAVFLETLTRPTGFAGPYLTNANVAVPTDLTPPVIYDFTVDVQLTPGARSGRYTQPGGPTR